MMTLNSEFRGDSDKDMSDSDEEDETLQKLAEKIPTGVLVRSHLNLPLNRYLFQ